MDYDQEISADISADAVCGENLEDDSGFQNFFFEAQGTPERFDGQSTTPAEPPEWRDVKKQALEYLKKTRDLKLASILAQTVLNTEGVLKFEQCLKGILLLVQDKWTEVYPPLDEDDGDPLERISALGHLADKPFVVDAIKTLPVAKSKVLGILTIQLIERSLNPGNNDEGNLDLGQIKGIFKDDESEDHTEVYNAAKLCIEHLKAISQAFIDQAGNEYSVNFDSTIEAFGLLVSTLEKYATLELPEPEVDEDAGEGEGQATGGGAQSAVQAFGVDNMKLSSRQDVEQCLGMILDYYQEFEPSSPIPVLIHRAQKLVHSDFLDIVKDIFPEALEQIKTLGGYTEEAPEESASESSGSSW